MTQANALIEKDIFVHTPNIMSYDEKQQ